MYYDLLDICDFQGGTQPPKDKWIKESKDGYVRMLQIRDFSQSDDKFIEYVKDSEQLHKCKKDDIMLSRYGYIGQAFMGLEGAYNVALVKVIKKNSVNTKYLYYYFKSNVFKHYLLSNVGARATIPGFNKSELKDAKINIKPLDEQIQIVKILERCEDIINKLNKEIEDFDLLIKARFIEMFGDPEINQMGWAKRPLSSVIVNANNGMTRRGNDKDGNIVMRLVELQDGYIDYSNPNRITLQDSEKKRYLLKDKDFLFARVNGNPNNVGRCAVFHDIGEDVYHNDHIIRVHFNELMLNGTFASVLFNSDYGKQQLRGQIKTSAGQYTVSQDGIGAIIAIMPPIELQNQFADFVKQIDKSKLAVQQSLKKTQLLFDSLMQEYFGEN